MKLSRELLENYITTEREIKRINQKLDYYSSHPLSSSHGVVKGSMGSFPYAECHFVVGAPDVKSTNERESKVRNLVCDLQSKKKEYEKIMLDLDIAIEDIEDMEMRQIIQMKYVDRCTDGIIGDTLGYDRSTISKKINKFLGSL